MAGYSAQRLRPTGRSTRTHKSRLRLRRKVLWSGHLHVRHHRTNAVPTIPNHISPRYSDEVRDDALLHYTTARGLLGILSTGQLWSTAYYCANDETELAAGKGVVSPLFNRHTHDLINKNDPRVVTFARRGVDPREYGRNFEQQIIAMALSQLGVFITCFCKAAGEEDFRHGLLSQWRGYAMDGGYALQFSRKKLLAAIESAGAAAGLNYDLMDAHYEPDNPLKAEVLRYSDSFVQAYSAHLDELAQPLDFSKKTMRSPIAGLPGGPLEALLNYLAHTKNVHFREERECRLSLVQPTADIVGSLPVSYFERSGIPVPYTQTPKATFDVLGCIEWVVVGPAPRLDARFKAVAQLARQYGTSIMVRPSHIPFTRL